MCSGRPRTFSHFAPRITRSFLLTTSPGANLTSFFGFEADRFAPFRASFFLVRLWARLSMFWPISVESLSISWLQSVQMAVDCLYF